MRALRSLLNFFSPTFERIVADFKKASVRLEALAQREERKAEDFLATHISVKAMEADARAAAERARTVAANIRKLLG